MTESTTIWEDIYQSQEYDPYIPAREGVTRFLDTSCPKHGSVLEVGCGDGRNLRELLKRRYDAFGFDISPSAVENARRSLVDVLGFSADEAEQRVQVADMRESFPKMGPNTTYDSIIASDSIHYTEPTQNKTAYDHANHVFLQIGKNLHPLGRAYVLVRAVLQEGLVQELGEEIEPSMQVLTRKYDERVAITGPTYRVKSDCPENNLVWHLFREIELKKLILDNGLSIMGELKLVTNKKETGITPICNWEMVLR